MTSSSASRRWSAPRELSGLALLALAAVVFEGGFEPLRATALVPLASAAIGTWCLARRHGIGRAGAWLAAAGFALAWMYGWRGVGANVLAHLPWALLALDAAARAPGAARLALVLVAHLLLFGAARPELRGALALACCAWALDADATGGGSKSDRVQRLSAAAIGALLGVVVSPHGTGALWIAASPPRLDALGIGLALACAGALGLARERGLSTRSAALALAVFLAALGAALAQGFALDAALGLAPDTGGAPVAPVLLGLAVAAALDGARGAVLVAGAGAFAVAVGFPGMAELWASLPFLGLAPPAALAAPAALMLGCSAARALPTLAPVARHRAALLVALALGVAWLSPTREATFPLDAPDELLAWELHVGAARAGATLVTGRVDAGLPAAGARVRLLPLDDEAREPVELGATLGDASAQTDAPRALLVLHDERSAALAPGRWLVVLALERATPDGEREAFGVRRLGIHVVARPACGSALRAALVVLLLLVPAARARSLGAIGLVLAEGLARAWCASA